MKHMINVLIVVNLLCIPIEAGGSDTYIYQDMYDESKYLVTNPQDSLIDGRKYTYIEFLFDGIWCRFDSLWQVIGYRCQPDTIHYYDKTDGQVRLKEKIYPAGEFDLFKYQGLIIDSSWQIAHNGMLYKATLQDVRDAVYTPYQFFTDAYHISLKGVNLRDAYLEIWLVPRVGIIRLDSKITDYRLRKIK